MYLNLKFSHIIPSLRSQLFLLSELMNNNPNELRYYLSNGYIMNIFATVLGNSIYYNSESYENKFKIVTNSDIFFFLEFLQC